MDVNVLSKVCRICGVDTPSDSLVIDTTTPRKVHYKALCKTCANKKTKLVNDLRKDYPYPSEDYSCPICFKAGVKFYLDHDWDTKLFRGYLCNQCNVALGHFRDDVNTLNRAIDYLRGNSSKAS